MPIAVRLHLRAALLAAALLVLLAAGAAAHAATQLGPKPGRCGTGCWGDVRSNTLSVSYLADFTIEPLIARPGEKVTGTVSPSGNEALKGWTWRPFARCADRALTCTWRAGRATRDWIVVGMAWQNVVGPALTEAVYAVVGKDDAVLEGYVRDRIGDGVGGISLRLAQIGGRGSQRVTTGGDGYYSAIVKPGKWSIFPLSRARKKDEFAPAFATVRAREGNEARADFKLDVGLKVSIVSNVKTVPADGVSVAVLTVRAERDGKPLPNVKIDVWPQRSVIAEKTATPLVLCTTGRRLWPSAEPGVAGAGLAQSVTTDGNGRATVLLRAGTVPGVATISAWALDGIEERIARRRQDVQDVVDVTLAPRPVGRTNTPATYATFKNLLQDFSAGSSTDLITSNPQYLADQLMDAASAAGFGNLSFHPIWKPSTGESGVLVTTADTRFELTQDGSVTSSAGIVIPYRALDVTYTGAFGGFPGTARQHQLPDFPSLDLWRLGAASGYTSKEGLTATPTPGWAYYGWPRYQRTCG